MNFKTITETRRAVNFFDTTRDVTDAQLNELLTTAANAPSGFNLQPWNLIVLRDMEEKKRLQALAWDQPKVSEAPVTLIVLADKSGYKAGNPTFEKNWEEMLKSGGMVPEKREWFEGATQTLYGVTPEAELAFAVKNTGFFAVSLMYAATAMGLATHPMDGFDHDGVKAAFNIPENFWVPLLISIGYVKPDIEVQPPKWRKTPEELIVRF